MLHIETTYVDGGKEAAKPLKWWQPQRSLKPVGRARLCRKPNTGNSPYCMPILSEHLTKLILDEVGSGEAVEAFGKSAVVGLNGELEHASALIHTTFW